MYSFQHIEYLTALAILLPLLLLFLVALRWKKRLKRKIGDEELVDALTADHSPQNYNYKFLFLAIRDPFIIKGL